MEAEPKEVLLPENYLYSKEGNLWFVLPVEKFEALPQTVTVDEMELKRKSEFHITIINGIRLAKEIAGTDTESISDIEKELQMLFSVYEKDNPIEFSGFIDDLRLAVTAERTSIAARCEIKNLEGYYDIIRSRFGVDIPLQPPHVSIYTLTGPAVGINSEAEMEAYKKLDLPEVQSILDSITFA